MLLRLTCCVVVLAVLAEFAGPAVAQQSQPIGRSKACPVGPARSPCMEVVMLRRLSLSLILWIVAACADGIVAPQGTYHLVMLNDQGLPYDDTLGCCIYVSGSLDMQTTLYEVGITLRNKNNGIEATVREQGSFAFHGSAIDFLPTGGDVPMHLYGATVEGNTISLALGGDGPGAADQFSAVFQK